MVITNYNLLYKEKLKQENDMISNLNPKISVILPIYNGGKYLIYSLKSIQEQKMKQIEIIIIDDNSSDNSVQIIKNYMRNDKRIKLIVNKVNRKILFCKSIGTLNSKGKYIIELDQDDKFIRNDAFNIIYNEAEKNGLDILNFKYIEGNQYFRKYQRKIYKNEKNNNPIIQQPQLKFSTFNTYICLLWGNLIKSDLYKKVIYNLWPIIINYKIIFQEDFLITFFILIYAKKSESIKNIFLFHFLNENSASSGHLNNSEYLYSIIFAGNIFYDYHIDLNPQDLPILINYIKFLKDHFKLAQKRFLSFFNFFIGKLLSNKQISKDDTNFLINTFNISENCANYTLPNLNQRLILKESLNNKKNVSNQIIKIIKISIIIIIQSNLENIAKLINSLNSQNFGYFEIILVFDAVNKNIFSLIRNFIKKYKHIKLIKNKIKKGKFVSIYKGIIVANGKYLIILDENCFFNNRNDLNIIYNEIEKNELDILEFDLYKILSNNYTNLYKCKHFHSQFNFKRIKYNLNQNDIDINKELLTNKIIKTNYFRNCIKKYKLKEINEIIDNYFNEIYTFVLESYKPKYNHTSGVKLYKKDFYFDKFKFNNFSFYNEQLHKEINIYINFIFEYSKDTYKSKERVLNEFVNVLSILFNKFTNTTKYSIKLMDKFMNSKFISVPSKNWLKLYNKSLIN